MLRDRGKDKGEGWARNGTPWAWVKGTQAWMCRKKNSLNGPIPKIPLYSTVWMIHCILVGRARSWNKRPTVLITQALCNPRLDCPRWSSASSWNEEVV